MNLGVLCFFYLQVNKTTCPVWALAFRAYTVQRRVGACLKRLQNVCTLLIYCAVKVKFANIYIFYIENVIVYTRKHSVTHKKVFVLQLHKLCFLVILLFFNPYFTAGSMLLVNFIILICNLQIPYN